MKRQLTRSPLASALALVALTQVTACASGDEHPASAADEARSEGGLEEPDGLAPVFAYCLTYQPRHSNLVEHLASARSGPFNDWCAREEDHDGDLIPERIDFQVLDDQSRLKTAVTTDTNCRIQTVSTYTYDDASNLTKMEIDARGDGTVDSEVIWRYDDHGNLVGVKNTGWGTAPYEASWRHEYDEDGQIIAKFVDDELGTIQHFGECGIEATQTNSGLQREVRYNSACQPVEILVYSQPGDVLASSIHRLYSITTSLIEAEMTDLDGDGIADHVTRYQHDEHGSIVFESTSNDGDNAPELSTSYSFEYNSQGHPTSEVRITTTAIGSRTDITTWSYDVGGRITSEKEEDLETNAATLREWAYDPAGNLLYKSFSRASPSGDTRTSTEVFDYSCHD
jgi:YD repeat-containing protein